MQPLTIQRIGGFGDHIFMSSVFPFLMEQHSDIHLEVNMQGLDIFLGDPRFDYISVFDGSHLDEVEQYRQYTARWVKVKKDCDKLGRRYLNFWSSIENSCILHEFNEDVQLTREERACKYGSNYYETHFEIAELKMPDGWIHENTLYFSEQETGIVERWRERNKDDFLMLLALGGSSRQKVFIWIEEFCKKLIDQYPKLKIYLMGGSELKNDTWEYERTFSYVNGASPVNICYRQAALMTKYADYVFGGETGLLTAAGMMGTPKTILFTITKKDQITKYHRNDYSVQSLSSCSPCHVLAYSGTICETENTYNAFPKCTTEYDFDELANIFDKLYCKRF